LSAPHLGSIEIAVLVVVTVVAVVY
jgi:hypothetical protein